MSNQQTYTERVLSGSITSLSYYLPRRIRYLVLRLRVEQDTDDIQTLLLITYSRGTIALEMFKRKDRFAVAIDNSLNILQYADESYMPMYKYPPVSGLTITEFVRPYANGEIEQKRYTVNYYTESILIPSSTSNIAYEVPTTYAVITMESVGTNARYGVKIENIPAFPSFIALEHVHLGRSWRRSVVEIRLYSTLM